MKKKQFLRDAYMQSMLGASQESCAKIIGEGFIDIYKTLEYEILDKHDRIDYPAIVAAFEVTAQMLRATLGSNGNGYADELKKRTHAVAIDGNELLRQCKEMGGETE